MSQPMYRISEIFPSIQGEGFWSGTPVTFIRFAGCNLSCSFCDTDHREKFTVTAADIVGRVKGFNNSRIVLTGGEPLLQIREGDPLLQHLHDEGYVVHVETNGTQPCPFGIDWLTVSPKGRQVITRGNELKVIYTAGADLAQYRTPERQFTHYYLQPLWSGESSNVLETVKAVMENPTWKLSIQLHKLIGIA